MAFPFDECVEILRSSLIEALTVHGETLRDLNRVEPFLAMTFDILPWDPYLGIGFRIEAESTGVSLTHSADWKHGRLIGDWNSTAIASAQEFIHRAYKTLGDGGDEMQEAAHLIFLAGADALLDERVAVQLQSLGVKAPIRGDTLPWDYFQYLVIDIDCAIKTNYCDIVSANRVTRRILGRMV